MMLEEAAASDRSLKPKRTPVNLALSPDVKRDAQQLKLHINRIIHIENKVAESQSVLPVGGYSSHRVAVQESRGRGHISLCNRPPPKLSGSTCCILS
jgi:hypothetical protein